MHTTDKSGCHRICESNNKTLPIWPVLVQVAKGICLLSADAEGWGQSREFTHVVPQRRSSFADELQNCSSGVWSNPLWSSTEKCQGKLVWSLQSRSCKAKITLKQRKCELSLNWSHWHSAKTRIGEQRKIRKYMCVWERDRYKDTSMLWKEIVFST